MTDTPTPSAGAMRQQSADLAACIEPAPSGWRPIETAPKGGARFLAYEAEAEPQHYECWRHEGYGEGQWWTDWADSEPDPSHWMPLPPPPADTTPQEGS